MVREVMLEDKKSERK